MSHAIKPPQAQLSNQRRAVVNGQLWSPWKLSVCFFFFPHKIVFQYLLVCLEMLCAIAFVDLGMYIRDPNPETNL